MAYATRQDFMRYGLPIAVAAASSREDLDGMLQTRSEFIDDYLRARGRYALPLKAPLPAALVQKVCELVQFDLLGVRGFNPEGTLDAVIRMRFEDAVSWCKDVAAGRVNLAVPEASGPADGAGAVQPNRGAPGGSFVATSPRLRGF